MSLTYGGPGSEIMPVLQLIWAFGEKKKKKKSKDRSFTGIFVSMMVLALLLNYLNILWMLMNLLLNNLLCTLHNVGITVANPLAPHFLLFKWQNVCLSQVLGSPYPPQAHKESSQSFTLLWPFSFFLSLFCLHPFIYTPSISHSRPFTSFVIVLSLHLICLWNHFHFA